jgi:hypothetical protein
MVLHDNGNKFAIIGRNRQPRLRFWEGYGIGFVLKNA